MLPLIKNDARSTKPRNEDSPCQIEDIEITTTTAQPGQKKPLVTSGRFNKGQIMLHPLPNVLYLPVIHYLLPTNVEVKGQGAHNAGTVHNGYLQTSLSASGYHPLGRISQRTKVFRSPTGKRGPAFAHKSSSASSEMSSEEDSG